MPVLSTASVAPHLPTPPPAFVRLIAGILLAVLLLLLALRLTSTETLRETLSQKKAHLADTTPAVDAPAYRLGPMVTVMESAVAFLLAAGAALLAACTAGLTRARWVHLILIAAILVCVTVSTLHAANRWSAIIGAADFATALISAWTLAVLLSLLGDAGRRAVIAGLLAICAVWIAKAYLQKCVEFPDVVSDYREHREDRLRSQGIAPDDVVKVKLFESRLKAAEVSGFLAASNVFATGLIGFLALLGALVTAQVLAWLAPVSTVASRPRPPPAPRFAHHARAPIESSTSRDIPVNLVCTVLAAMFLAAGLVALFLTGSKGGLALGLASVGAIVLGGFFRPFVVRQRRRLMMLMLAALLAGAAAVLLYGLHFDRLPTKSLLFRWHYWTASAPIIKLSPAWGVGLNNFGDYYGTFKRPSSPEDVKDPHNFFIRLAAEAGLPAALLTAALLAWLFHRALRRAPVASGNQAAVRSWLLPPIVAAIVTGALWATIHVTVFDVPFVYNIDIAIIFAVLAAGAFALTLVFFQSLDPTPVLSRGPASAATPGAAPGTFALRYIMLAGALGAAAMLLYDQINLALVTGPVAMFFWMLLALSDDDTPRQSASIRSFASRALAGLPAILCAAAAVTLFAAPIAIFPACDPAPFEDAYVRQLAANDLPAARRSLEAALARSPNSIELHMDHISLLRERLHEPVAAEIRRVLALDRSNAGIRVSVALPDSDLPAAERAAILRQALELDQQLPPEEYKRLSPEQIAQITQRIRELDAAH